MTVEIAGFWRRLRIGCPRMVRILSRVEVIVLELLMIVPMILLGRSTVG